MATRRKGGMVTMIIVGVIAVVGGLWYSTTEGGQKLIAKFFKK